MNNFSEHTKAAMEDLLRCHNLCLSMVMTHCLEMGGEHARPQHVRLMMDCAEACAFTARLLAHKSQFHTVAAGLCADICETCAEDCANLGNMELCVAACRDCAVRCRELSRPDHAEILEMASRLPPGR